MKLKLEDINWIMENEYKKHPNFSIEEQLEHFLECLGSPESQFREGSLSIFGSWIERGDFSDEQLLDIANKMKENLLVGLGENNTDSVFLRSFSALILGDIIGFDEECSLQNVKDRKPFLTKELILDLFKTSLKYYRGEKDVRGYIEIKEWAHSVAHGADLFKKFARHRLLEKAELLQILDVFKVKLIDAQEDVYKAREELRITVAVYTLFLRRILTTEEIKEWFSDFEEVIISKKWYEYVKEPSKLNVQLNLRAFLNYMYLIVKNGIANTGFYDLPFYQNNLLKDRVEISNFIERLLLLMDKNHFCADDEN